MWPASSASIVMSWGKSHAGARLMAKRQSQKRRGDASYLRQCGHERAEEADLVRLALLPVFVSISCRIDESPDTDFTDKHG